MLNVPFEQKVIDEFLKILFKFNRRSVYKLTFFGSSLHGTNVGETRKLSLFLSIKKHDLRSIEKVMSDYANYFRYLELDHECKNETLLVNFKETLFELTFGKHKSGTYDFYYLYNPATHSIIVTNPNLHDHEVQESGLQQEIILLKLWRNKLNLDFPSIYLEMVVLKALKFKPKRNLLGQMLRLLHYLKTEFPQDKFYDLSNTNNIVSDCLTVEKKKEISLAAEKSLSQNYINEILA